MKIMYLLKAFRWSPGLLKKIWVRKFTFRAVLGNRAVELLKDVPGNDSKNN